MSTRPVRQSSKDAAEKIRNILEWENCAESSELFKLAAARMNEEFEQVKRRRTQAPTNGYTTPTENDGEESDDDGSAPDSDDVDSMYSDNASSDDSGVEEEDECESSDCESAGDVACTTDVARTVHVECQPDAEPKGP